LKDYKLHVVYVGDAKDVVKRIRSDHCNGNVEASALRKSVAIAKGYLLKKTKRPSGSTRIRIDLPVPRKGETCISGYIQSSEWRFVLCASSMEAKDFQWYAIDQLADLCIFVRG
jgi:hypothetical protein